jgi:ABC-type transport system substrate-binding protein
MMNVAEAPFDDVEVRRAVNLVLDKDGMRRAFGGPFYGEIAGHTMPNALFGNDPRVVDYDPYATAGARGDVEAAKAAMRRSRHDTDGDGVCDTSACRGVLFVNRAEAPYPRLTPVVRESLAKIGITLEVREMPTGASYDAVGAPRNRVQLMANVVWGKDFPDPTTYAVLFDGRNILDSGNSATSLVGLTRAQARTLGIPYPEGGVPSVDRRITACNAAVGAARRDCWIELEKTLMEDVVPWAPYMFSANTDLLGPAVTRWDFDQFSGEAALAHVAVDPSRQ